MLTGNGARLAVWSLPECKAEVQAYGKPHLAELSPNGKLIAIADEDGARLLEAATLAVVGDLMLPNRVGFAKSEIKALAFHPDGAGLAAQFAVTFNDSSTGVSVVSWDLNSGKASPPATTRVAVAPMLQESSVEFVGNDHFLVNNNLLLASGQSDPLWTFAPGFDVRHAAMSPDGRHWFTARTELGKDAAVLTSADISRSKIFDWVKLINSAPKVLWKSGGEISVNVQIGEGQDKVQKSLEAALTRQGMKIVSGSANVLSVTAVERATGKTTTFNDRSAKSSGIKGKAPVITVGIVETEVTASMTISGTPVWQAKAVFSNAGHLVEFLKQGESLEGHLAQRMRAGAQSFAFRHAAKTGRADDRRSPGAARPSHVFRKGAGSFSARGQDREMTRTIRG